MHHDQPSSIIVQDMQEHIKEMEELITDIDALMVKWFYHVYMHDQRWIEIRRRMMELGIRRKD